MSGQAIPISTSSLDSSTKNNTPNNNDDNAKKTVSNDDVATNVVNSSNNTTKASKKESYSDKKSEDNKSSTDTTSSSKVSKQQPAKQQPLPPDTHDVSKGNNNSTTSRNTSPTSRNKKDSDNKSSNKDKISSGSANQSIFGTIVKSSSQSTSPSNSKNESVKDKKQGNAVSNQEQQVNKEGVDNGNNQHQQPGSPGKKKKKKNKKVSEKLSVVVDLWWVCVYPQLYTHTYVFIFICLCYRIYLTSSFNPPFFIIQLNRRKRIIKIVHTGNNNLLNRTSSLLPQVTLYLKNLITRMPRHQGMLLQRVKRHLNLLKAVAVEAHRLPLQRRRIHRRMYHLLTTSPPRISSLLLPKVENLLALFPNSKRRVTVTRAAVGEE